MPINEWSESILIAELADEPSLSEDMDSLIRKLDEAKDSLPDVVVNMQNVSYMNSSNIAQLLKLRKQVLDASVRLRLCTLNDRVKSILTATGLDNVFQVHDGVAMAIASLQLEAPEA